MDATPTADRATNRAARRAAKAAAILLAMGKPTATRLLKHLEPDELREVTRAAARLGAFRPRSWRRWSRNSPRTSPPAPACMGDVGKRARPARRRGAAAKMVADILSDRARRRGTSASGRASRRLPEALLQSSLANEHPLIATYILSKLDLAADGRRSSRAAARTAQRGAGQADRAAQGHRALQCVEDAVRRPRQCWRAPRRVGRRNRAAHRRHHQRPRAARRRRRDEGAGAARPKDAQAVRAMLFSFHDLPRLSQRGARAAVRQAHDRVVVLALRGTDAEFREPALSAMASRSRRLVESELGDARRASPREIAKARREIVKLVLAMAQTRRNRAALRRTIRRGGIGGGDAR